MCLVLPCDVLNLKVFWFFLEIITVFVTSLQNTNAEDINCLLLSFHRK